MLIRAGLLTLKMTPSFIRAHRTGQRAWGSQLPSRLAWGARLGKLAALPSGFLDKLLGTNEWFVIHHTDCGMLTFTNKIRSELLDDNLETASFDGLAVHYSLSEQAERQGLTLEQFMAQWEPPSSRE
jgi:hypothetical protein